MGAAKQKLQDREKCTTKRGGIKNSDNKNSLRVYVDSTRAFYTKASLSMMALN